MHLNDCMTTTAKPLTYTQIKYYTGDKVQLTAKFLRSTRQQRGGEGAKVWEVLGFDNCWAIVNEPVFDLTYFTPTELEADPSLKWRRIAVSNLKLVRSLEVES